MNLSLLFWAKLGSATWPEEYHPVLCHLLDVAAVTQELWNAAFRPRLRCWLAGHFGLDEDDCARWLAFWSGAHDIGKVAPCFQDRNDPRTDALKKRLQDAGLVFYTWDKPHGTISSAILAEHLSAATDWPLLDRQLAAQVAIAVGGHHGLFPADWMDVADLLRSAPHPCLWDTARREILSVLARLLGVGSRAPKITEPNDHSVFMVLAGLTSVADWIGSNQEFFPPKGCSTVAESGLDLDDYFAEAQDRAHQALTALGWLERGDPGAIRSFEKLFSSILPGAPRPLQRVVSESAQQMTTPTLMVVEAPMGEGKTEAAWYVAKIWEQIGGKGVYVALPTMTTSDQMFERVGKFLEADAGGNLMLLHGKAQLNKQFEELKKFAAQIYNDDEKKPSAVVAEAWFAANKKHGLLAPYGVGTIDQALLAVLQTKHVFVRLFGLAGKCVILDEVHAYDAYMTTLMERLLRWLAALGCPVVLLSATLPRDKRLKLLRAYAGDDLPEPEDVSYPRLTSVAVGQPAEVRHVEADPDRARTIKLGWVDEGNLVETLRKSLANGGCAAVIRNTVGLAQTTYLQLRDALKADGIDIELFHARFPFGRRREIEDVVLNRFGKNGGPAERNKRVLVATQVVEQSLDLDFDVMISDLAPVDLVLQRAGRLHRHARGPRPDGVSQPCLWLIEPPTKDGLPDFGVSGFVYSPHVLFRSLLTFQFDANGKRDKLYLPSEIDALINRVYEELLVPDWLSPVERDFWAKTHAEQQETIQKEEGEAECRQIKKPRFRGTLTRVVQEPRDEDNPDLHPAHQALTRLTRPTVSLICLLRHNKGTYFLPHDNSPVRTLAIRKMSSAGFKDISRLMLAEITSAHRGLLNALRVAPSIPREWKDIGLLSRHHLIAFNEGKARVGPYELELDYCLGLTITRDNAQGEDE